MKWQVYLVGLVSIAFAVDARAFDEQVAGVVVEVVSPNSEAERAGFEPGDILQSWARDDAKGDAESPFEISLIEIEQAQRAPVTIHGSKQIWTLGPGHWGLKTRPDFPSTALATYQQGQELAKAGKLTEAAQRWQSAASELDTSVPSWLPVWFLSRAADAFAANRQWRDADAAYERAVQLGAQTRPEIRVQMLRAWAESFAQREDWVNAEKRFQQAADESEKLSSASLLLADALDGLGFAALRRTHFAQAEKYYAQAFQIQQKLAPNSLGMARSVNGMGSIAERHGNLRKAEEDHKRALAIQEKLAPGSIDVADSLGGMGNVALIGGDLAKAEDSYKQALAIYEKLAPGGAAAAKVLANLGIVAGNGGDSAKTEEYFHRSLAIQQELAPGSLGVASLLQNLGVVAMQRGDWVEAEELTHQALAIEEKLEPESLLTAESYTNLGRIAEAHQDVVRAEQYYRSVLAIQQKQIADGLSISKTLDSLGDVARLRNDWLQAKKYYRRSLWRREKLAPGSLDVAYSYGNLGLVAHTAGDFAKAEEYYNRALAIEEKLAPGSGDTAQNLAELGEVFRDRGELNKAETRYRQALAIEEKQSQTVEYAEALAGLAEVMVRKRQFNEAAPLFGQALDALESQTAHLGGTEENRSQFRAQHADFYKEYVALLVNMGKPELAFHVLERSRARTFLEMLAERNLVFSADLPHEIQQERQQNFAAYDSIQSQIADLNPAKDSAQIQQLQTRLRDLQEEREQIAERVRKASPRLAALQYPRPLDITGARQALDAGTVLLSYSVGRRETILFAIRQGTNTPEISVFHLPLGEKALRKQVEVFRKSLQGWKTTDRTAFAVASTTLYKALLAPAETVVAPAERVLIVPDGALQVLPFGALLRDRDHYLIEWKPVHTVISATVYAELKSVTGEYESDPLQLVAFGAPKYPPLDPTHPQTIRSPELRAAAERGFVLAPLPFSKDEVSGIAEFFPGHAQVFLGEQATEENAKSVDNSVRYLHFATHAMIDERFPLNSSLVLTIPKNPGMGEDNGLLQAWEIFEQVRINADLVTLSACETGLGKEVEGEGLIGLTRAFQYAGARSVLASLWSIPDASTADFMKRFYGHLKEGKSKDEALRQAQLEFLRQPQFLRPFYWAAFSLNGDWR